MPVRRKPVYSLHKSSGQARVRIDGREVYLRVYGSPESLARYDELILKWLACDPEAARGAGWRFVAIPPPDSVHRWRGFATGGSAAVRGRIQWSVSTRSSVTLTAGMWQPRQSAVDCGEEQDRVCSGRLP